MANARKLNLHYLHNTDYYRGVTPETRTAIINAMGFDIEGLTKQEGGKYSEQELISGLRYLLANNQHLRRYMETSPNYSNHSDPSSHQH